MAVSTFERKEITGGGTIHVTSGTPTEIGMITRLPDDHYILKSAYLEDGNYRYSLPNQYATIFVRETGSTSTRILVSTTTYNYRNKYVHYTLELDKMCNHYS